MTAPAAPLDGPQAPASSDWSGVSIYTLGLVTLIYALSFLDRTIMSLVLPLIKKDMALSDTMLGLITGAAFVLLYSTLGIPIGRLADRSNRRNILGIGCAIWSVMTALTGVAANAWHLALTRFLMGAAEAAGIPPATALLSDRFGPQSRALALSIMTSGTGIASLALLPIMGFVAQSYGWRAAFVSAGLFGLAVSTLFLLTVPEPIRRQPVAKIGPSLRDVIAHLRGLGSYRFLLAGGIMLAINSYALLTWTPTFLERVHGFTLGQVGATFGPIKGVANIAGVIFGGIVSTWAARRDPAWLLLVPAIGAAVAVPAELLFLLSPNLPLAFVGLAIASFAGVIHFGPVYAAIAAIVPPSMRATAVAVMLFCVNIVGQIVGPLLIGWLNDRWALAYGQDAVRYSMIVGSVAALLAAVFLALGSRWLGGDMAATRARAE